MRKKAAMYGATIALALMAGTLALPASDSAGVDRVDAAQVAATPHVQGSITVHQLLRNRLDWTLRLTRALRLVNQPPAAPSSYGTLTIIDEPDPAGREDDSDPPSGDRPKPVHPDRNPFTDDTDGMVAPGYG